MGIRKDRTTGHTPGKAGRTSRRTTRKYPKGTGLQVRCADKREAGSRGRAVVWQQRKFTYFTMTPVLPMATLRKSMRSKAAQLLAFREQEAGGNGLEDNAQARSSCSKGNHGPGHCTGPFLSASSPHHHSSFWGDTQRHDYAHCCSFLFTRDRSLPLGPSHLIPTIIPSLSTQSTSLSAFSSYSSTSFFLHSASSSFSSEGVLLSPHNVLPLSTTENGFHCEPN